MEKIRDSINNEFKPGDTVILKTKFGPFTGTIIKLNEYYIQLTGCHPTYKYLSYDILYVDIHDFKHTMDYDLGI